MPITRASAKRASGGKNLIIFSKTAALAASASARIIHLDDIRMRTEIRAGEVPQG
jgi:hypothetical protein